MATDYPIEITDPDGSVRIAGLADFIDPGNAPGAGTYVQASDPGAVGAGSLWVNTTGIAGSPCVPVSVRSADNSTWQPVGLAIYNDGVLRAIVTLAPDGGIAIESNNDEGAAVAFLLITNSLVLLSCASGQVAISADSLVSEAATIFNSSVTMAALPTSDPGNAGELYTLAGVVNVSAG